MRSAVCQRKNDISFKLQLHALNKTLIAAYQNNRIPEEYAEEGAASY